MISVMRKCHRFENFYIFISCVCLYVINTLFFSNLANPKLNCFFNCFFNDLLAPILLFSYINLVLSFYNKKLYSLKYLFLITIACSFVWEYLILFFKPTSVSDPIDVLFYFLGTMIYWIIYKNWIHKNMSQKRVYNVPSY